MVWRGGVVALVAAALFGPLAVAQEEPPLVLEPQERKPVAQFLERVQVTVGTVDVTVVDADGNLVTDLTKDDFVLLVDGKPTAISNFSAYARAVQTGESGAASAEPGEPPESAAPRRPGVLVILVDSSNTALFNRNHLLKRVRAWVDASLRPPDRAIVAVYQEYLRFATPLTSSVEEIDRALEGLLSTSSGVGATRAYRIMAERQLRDLAERSNPGNRDATFDQAVMVARVNATQMRNATRKTLDALKVLLHTLSGASGRKALVYASDGLPARPGEETFQLLLELFPQATPADTESFTYDTGGLFQELARWAAAAEVTLYTIDARGVATGDQRSAEQGGYGADTFARSAGSRTRLSDVDSVYRYNYQDPLITMANLTGGIAITDTNDFEGGLARIADAMETYYSLGFEMAPAAEDAAHAVRIGVKGREGLRLRYRTTIVERSLTGRVEDRTVAGLAFDLGENPIGVRLELGRPLPAGKKRYSVPVRILVPVGNLALVPGDAVSTGRIRLFTVAAGGEGRRSAIGRADHTIEIPADKVGRIGTIAVDSSVEVPTGECRISVGVLDEQANRASYATANLRTGG